MHLTLLIPGLSWLSEDNLSQFLQKANVIGLNQIPTYARINPLSNKTLGQFYQQYLPPYSKLTFFYEHGLLTPASTQLLVNPVHLQVHLAHLSLEESHTLTITAQEALQLCADVNDFLQKEHWVFTATSPQLWTLTLPDSVDVQFIPLEDIDCRNINAIELTGKDAAYIQKITAEIQTFLFAHPVNQQRTSMGQATINSLWFSSPLHTSQLSEDTIKNSQFYVPDPIWQTQFGSLATPDDFTSWQQSSSTRLAQAHTILIDSLLAPARYQDYWGYLDTLCILENTFFTPLWAALKSGTLIQLTIACHGAFGGQIDLTRTMTYAFWRKKHLFNGYLTQ